MIKRSSGILLHPTSLPNSFGLGDFGESAFEFIDFLKASGQSFWQMLPLGPTGYANSPYQSTSAFAGNPLLISPTLLLEDTLLINEDITHQEFPQTQVDYEAAIKYKFNLLQKAFSRYKLLNNTSFHKDFNKFCKNNFLWLDNFVLFSALKSYHNELPWNEWPEELRTRDPKALKRYAKDLKDELEFHRFTQFVFSTQFTKLKEYAHENGVQLIGDIPIFVAHDSSDVWSNPQWFELDKNGECLVVAGVPPDYFSKIGQRWGNPLYDWKALKADKYSFWVERLKHTNAMFDLIRLDHFRGFASYWEIPASEETAVNGKWKKGPGLDFFTTVEKTIGKKLPIIAEDLGVVSKDVIDLLKAVDYPGMAILQFGFESMLSDESDSFLPHNLKTKQVVYTGTHDNNTVQGWWQEQSEEIKDFTRRYLNTDARLIHRDMIRSALSSVCALAIFPMQDVLGLGEEACMNHPGTTDGNWQWRMKKNAMSSDIAKDLMSMSKIYGRIQKEDEKKK